MLNMGITITPTIDNDWQLILQAKLITSAPLMLSLDISNKIQLAKGRVAVIIQRGDVICFWKGAPYTTLYFGVLSGWKLHKDPSLNAGSLWGSIAYLTKA